MYLIFINKLKVGYSYLENWDYHMGIASGKLHLIGLTCSGLEVLLPRVGVFQDGGGILTYSDLDCVSVACDNGAKFLNLDAVIHVSKVIDECVIVILGIHGLG